MLDRAQSLRWPLLAVVAGCFGDVAPLDCLAAWLGAGWASAAGEDVEGLEGSGSVDGAVFRSSSGNSLPAFATAAPSPAAPDPRPLARRHSSDVFEAAVLPPLSGPDAAIHRLNCLCEVIGQSDGLPQNKMRDSESDDVKAISTQKLAMPS
jgi:hypothetical protein